MPWMGDAHTTDSKRGQAEPEPGEGRTETAAPLPQGAPGADEVLEEILAQVRRAASALSAREYPISRFPVGIVGENGIAVIYFDMNAEMAQRELESRWVPAIFGHGPHSHHGAVWDLHTLILETVRKQPLRELDYTSALRALSVGMGPILEPHQLDYTSRVYACEPLVFRRFQPESSYLTFPALAPEEAEGSERAPIATDADPEADAMWAVAAQAWSEVAAKQAEISEELKALRDHLATKGGV